MVGIFASIGLVVVTGGSGTPVAGLAGESVPGEFGASVREAVLSSVGGSTPLRSASVVGDFVGSGSSSEFTSVVLLWTFLVNTYPGCSSKSGGGPSSYCLSLTGLPFCCLKQAPMPIAITESLNSKLKVGEKKQEKTRKGSKATEQPGTH